MTDTDATNRPLSMPVNFIPYLEKHRVYTLLKEMVKDLVLNLPKDHLKHMKIFLNRRQHNKHDTHRILILMSPELDINLKKVVKELIRNLGVFVITRRCIMDRYEKSDRFQVDCISPELMSEVTKAMISKDPVKQAGWLMFDHPCSVREATCLQQDGVLPTVTLLLCPPEPVAPPTEDHLTEPRNFFQQDYERLKHTYRATLKEVNIEPADDVERIATKCFNAVQASAAGAQGPGQALAVVGAPGVYRVLIIGPRGSGRRTQGKMLAKHFGLVFISFEDLLREAAAKDDEAGESLRKYGLTKDVKTEIVRRKLLMKDCLDLGWVMIGYPSVGAEFEILDNTKTPPNRIIFLNMDLELCKKRRLALGIDWCTGQEMAMGSGPRVLPKRADYETKIENDLDLYFTETLAELHAAAGITAVEVDGSETIEKVQVKIQAAVMAAPAFTIECTSQIKNVKAD